MSRESRSHKSIRVRETFRPKILVLCEGRDERRYFNSLQREFSFTGLELPATRFNTPRELVREAVRLKKEAKKTIPYDHVYVVVDHDNHPHHAEAFDQAKANDVILIFSNPCFEYWYLLHFSPTTKLHPNCESLITQLKTYLLGYKHGQDCFEKILPRIDTAVTNAKHICIEVQKAGSNKIYELSPFCNVWEIVEQIRTFSPLT